MWGKGWLCGTIFCLRNSLQKALASEVKMGTVALDLPLTSPSLEALTSKMDQNILLV